MLRSGCAWWHLPHDFPKWATVYHYFRRWRDDGTAQRIHDALRKQLQEATGRAAQPSAGIVLRSKKPDMVRQEFYGLLLAYFAIRGLMHEAALEVDEDPDGLSFTPVVRVIRRKLPTINAFSP